LKCLRVASSSPLRDLTAANHIPKLAPRIIIRT